MSAVLTTEYHTATMKPLADKAGAKLFCIAESSQGHSEAQACISMPPLLSSRCNRWPPAPNPSALGRELPSTSDDAIQSCRILGVASDQARGHLWCTPAAQPAGQKVHPSTHFHAGVWLLYLEACNSSLTCAGWKVVQPEQGPLHDSLILQVPCTRTAAWQRRYRRW